MFRLIISVPTGRVFDGDVGFLRAEDYTGSFGILSRHTDFLTILKPSVMIVKKEGKEIYFAVKGGIFSFRGNTARLTTEAAVQAEDLEELHSTLRQRFLKLTEKEQLLNETVSNLQQGFIRRMIEIEREYG